MRIKKLSLPLASVLVALGLASTVDAQPAEDARPSPREPAQEGGRDTGKWGLLGLLGTIGLLGLTRRREEHRALRTNVGTAS
ncbi:MAG TPA: WGxxGxxG family protein [Kofleriaceae bacterium]|jgi:hypothetical protein|nr:WGxxGxxG family protein [Kofleriaceae bacterium]